MLVAKKTELKELFSETRKRTEDIIAPLETEDMSAQPVMDVSPPKWHIAHTSWFFETLVLKKFAESYSEYNKDFAYLFNSYYNALGDRLDRNNRSSITRPSAKKVFAYRKYVDKHMAKLLEDNPGQEARDMIMLGIQHEQQHQELLLTDIKFILGTQALRPAYSDYSEGHKEHQQDWIKKEEGIYEIGFQGEGFCFDNELGVHKTYINEFEISSKLVTNREFIEFIEDGGYDNVQLWHSDGWNWVQENNISMPAYWEKDENGTYRYYTFRGMKDVEKEIPVSHISFYEAYAFAQWKGMRLPTEKEWEISSPHFKWGQRWEWTNSAYLPYPGFKEWEGPIGEYNGKFMVNQMVLRGASVATSPGHSRNTYRNFFHPQLRWQFTGLRLVRP